jgi:hypothetical protein
MLYYQIQPLGDGGKSDRSWVEVHVKKYACGHRDVFQKFYSSVTIDIENFELKYAISFISAPLMLVLRDDITEAIMPEIMSIKNIEFGRLVNNKTGNVMSDWKTLWMPPTTRIRGDHNVKYWMCPVCKNKIYHLPASSCKYFVEAEISEKPLCLCNGCLVLREDIYQRLIFHPQWNNMKKIFRIVKIKVLTKPLDGYPEVLSEYEPPFKIV